MDIPEIEDHGTDHTDDRAAIAALVADVERGFNTNDAELMIGPLAANASITTAFGTRTTGRAEALASGAAALAGPLRDDVAAYELTDVVFVRPDVAVAHKNAWAVEDGRRTTDDPAMVALYVFVKRDGRWWVVARQNTAVPRPAS